MEASPPNLGDHQVDAYAPTALRVVTFPENHMFVSEITFSIKSHKSIWTFLAEDVYIFIQDMFFPMWLRGKFHAKTHFNWLHPPSDVVGSNPAGYLPYPTGYAGSQGPGACI